MEADIDYKLLWRITLMDFNFHMRNAGKGRIIDLSDTGDDWCFSILKLLRETPPPISLVTPYCCCLSKCERTVLVRTDWLPYWGSEMLAWALANRREAIEFVFEMAGSDILDYNWLAMLRRMRSEVIFKLEVAWCKYRANECLSQASCYPIWLGDLGEKECSLTFKDEFCVRFIREAVLLGVIWRLSDEFYEWCDGWTTEHGENKVVGVSFDVFYSNLSIINKRLLVKPISKCS